MKAVPTVRPAQPRPRGRFLLLVSAGAQPNHVF
jgi:hypothetical protein